VIKDNNPETKAAQRERTWLEASSVFLGIYRLVAAAWKSMQSLESIGSPGIPVTEMNEDSR
jgi:hypothetical protein